MRPFWANVIGGVVTGLVVAAAIGIFAILKNISVYHLVLSDHLVWDWNGAKRAITPPDPKYPDHKPDAELGKHDVCMLSSVGSQKPVDGSTTCWVTQESEHVWWVHAKVEGTTGMANCEAVCADFK